MPLYAPVALYLRDDDGNDVVIQSAGPGDFNAGVRFFFYATLEDPKNPFYKESDYTGGYYLTLLISFDAFPEEIGVDIRTSSGLEILYRPPRYYYPDVLTVYSEAVYIPEAYNVYTLTIADIFGDGFGDINGTGYELWDGDPDTGKLLKSSSFATGRSEVFRFTNCDLAMGCSGSLAPPSNSSSTATTNAPSASPTLAPTNSPTVAPTSGRFGVVATRNPVGSSAVGGGPTDSGVRPNGSDSSAKNSDTANTSSVTPSAPSATCKVSGWWPLGGIIVSVMLILSI
jgi:hypothetical protein